MGVKLMTGATGEQNIQAADDRECLAGITGLDSYVFPTGSQLKATLVDANTVTIGTGAGSLQGSRFRCSTTTTVNIQSGTQGQYRRDIIGLHFSRETSGREGLEFQVLTGEPAASEGAAADPAYTAGDLLKGDADAFMPLYRVKLSGINAADPEPMFSVLAPLATLLDSVSQISNRVLLWSGTAGKGANITINSEYSFKEFKSFYCLTSADKTIGLSLVRNACIQQDQFLHGITGWDDGTTTWTLAGLIKINTETTATVSGISKHQIDGSGGISGNLLKLWGYY